MFKSKVRQNVELFTPLLAESNKSELTENKIRYKHEEIDMDFVGDGLKKLSEDNPGSSSMPKSKTSDKIVSLMEKKSRLAAERKKNRILAFNSDQAARRPEDCKLFIISIIVPLIVLTFLLVILFAFIVSPIVQGINAVSSEHSGDSKIQAKHHDGHSHDHDLLAPSSINSGQTTTLKAEKSDMSSSVKKDGGELHNQRHHGD